MLEAWEGRLKTQKEYLDNLNQQLEANQKIVSEQRQALMIEYDQWEREYVEYQNTIEKLTVNKPKINPDIVPSPSANRPIQMQDQMSGQTITPAVIPILDEPVSHYDEIKESQDVPKTVPKLDKKPSWAKVEGSIFEHLK